MNPLLPYGLAVVSLILGLTFAIRNAPPRQPWIDRIVLLGPVFIGMPMAVFGGDHLTVTASIAGLVPGWIPWHIFWTYLVGVCLVLGGLAIVSRKLVGLSAACFGIMMLCFVVLMDIPAVVAAPHNRLFWMLALREFCFGMGALSLAAAEARKSSGKDLGWLLATTRIGMALVLIAYGLEFFRDPGLLPGVPLVQRTPAFIPFHAIWGYPMGLVLVAGGIFVLADRKTYVAAASVGVAVLAAVMLLNVPFMLQDPASLDSLNVPVDTLLFCGSVLCLAVARAPARMIKPVS